MAQGVEKIPLRIPREWDPKWFEDFVREVLANMDIRNAIGNGVDISGQSSDVATLSVSQDIQDLLEQTFVLTAPSGFLQFERVLAGETGVVTITDGGANSNITVSITANGLPLGKLQQLSGYGILGNPTAAAANVTNISPTADGEALAVTAGVIGWTPTPTWAGDHKWLDGVGIVLGTGDDFVIEFDGTDGSLSVTGGMTHVATGDYEIAAATFTLSTTAADVAVDATGALLINGDAGDSGDVITSAGAGAPFAWAAQTGGGTTILSAVQDADLVITSNNVLQDTDVILPLTAGTWLITFDVHQTQNATPDMETVLSYTGTTTSMIGLYLRIRGTTIFSTNNLAALPYAQTETTTDSVYRRGSLRLTVSTSGNLKWQARQVTSSGTAVTWHGGSSMQAVKIS